MPQSRGSYIYVTAIWLGKTISFVNSHNECYYSETCIKWTVAEVPKFISLLTLNETFV